MVTISLRTTIVTIVIATAVAVAAVCLLTVLLTSAEAVGEVGLNLARASSRTAALSVQDFYEKSAGLPMQSVLAYFKAASLPSPSAMAAANGGDNTTWRKSYMNVLVSAYAALNYVPLGLAMLMLDGHWAVVSSNEAVGEDGYACDTVEPSGWTVAGISWRVGAPPLRSVTMLPYPVPITAVRVPLAYRDLSAGTARELSIFMKYQCIEAVGIVSDYPVYQALNVTLLASLRCPLRDVNGNVLGIFYVNHKSFSAVSQILRVARITAGTVNFLLDGNGHIVSTSARNLTIWYTYATLRTNEDGLPMGCSNSIRVDGVLTDKYIGCRLAPWSHNFTYEPLKAASRALLTTNSTAEETVNAADGYSYFIVSRRFTTLLGIRYNVVTVVPETDILSQPAVNRAIGISIGLTVAVVVVLILIVYAVLAKFVLHDLEDLTHSMLEVAKMRQYGGGGDDDLAAGGGTNSGTVLSNGDTGGLPTANGSSSDGAHTLSWRLRQLQQQQQHGGGNADPGWASVFTALNGLDDVDDLDLNNEADDAFADPAEPRLRGQSRNAATHARQDESAVADESAPRAAPTVTPSAVSSNANSNNGSEGGGSVISEIADVRAAYTAAISSLQRMKSYTVPSLVAADVQFQRAEAERRRVAAEQLRQHMQGTGDAAAAAASLDAATQRPAQRTIPMTTQQVTILVIELEQLATISQRRAPSPQFLHDVNLLLQTYFKRITRCVLSHGGVVHSLSAPVSSTNAVTMAMWGTSPVQQAPGCNDDPILAVLCACCIWRECARDPIAGRFRQVLGEPPLIRMSVATGLAQVGAIETDGEQVRHVVMGEVCSRSVALLAAARRWGVRKVAVVDMSTASACDLIIKFTLLGLTKFHTGSHASFLYAVSGLDVDGDVIKLVRQNRNARDAIVAARRRAFHGATGASTAAAGASDDGGGAANVDNLEEGALREYVVDSSEQNSGNSNRGSGSGSRGGGSRATAQSLRLSEAFSLGTEEQLRGSNAVLAEVLKPSHASLTRLLRWHATRTAVEPIEERFADLFSRCAKAVIEGNFSLGSRLLASLREDTALPDAVRESPTVARLAEIINTFAGERVPARNLVNGLFADVLKERY